MNILKQFEAVAAMLTLASLYCLSIQADQLGFQFGALGSMLWLFLAYELKLWFLAGLNFSLIMININGLINLGVFQ